MVGVNLPKKAKKDPWDELREAAPAVAAAAAPAPDPVTTGATGGGGLLSLLGGGGGGGGGGMFGAPDEGGFRDVLGNLGSMLMMMDPMSATAGTTMAQQREHRLERGEKKRGKNETAAWLQTQGVTPTEASFLASNPNALNSWYSEWKETGKPDWKIHELYNDKGDKQSYMIDMKTGNMSPIGGAAKDPPKLSIQTIYDENGNEQKALINEDTGETVTKIGGVKTGLLTPAELAQKKEIAGAGASSQKVEIKGEGKQSEKIGEGLAALQLDTQKSAIGGAKALGTLKLMESMVNSPDFESGGGAEGSEFMLKLGQLGERLGFGDAGSLATTEQFNALSKQSVMDKLGGTLGAGVSTADVQYLNSTVPNLGNSKEGNLALIRIQQRTVEQQMGLAAEIRKYAKAHNGLLDVGVYDKIEQYNELHPIIRPEDKAYIDGLSAIDASKTTGGPGGEGGDAAVVAPPVAAQGEDEVRPDGSVWRTVPGTGGKVQVSPPTRSITPAPAAPAVTAPKAGRVAAPVAQPFQLPMPNPARFR